MNKTSSAMLETEGTAKKLSRLLAVLKDVSISAEESGYDADGLLDELEKITVLADIALSYAGALEDSLEDMRIGVI